MSKVKIAGVVVLYNPEEDYIENINSYLNELDLLYVIDNSNTKHKIPNKKNIKYIFNDDNLGVAKALNMACNLSIKSGYKWILTMDQDTKFNSGVLEKMINYISSNDCNTTGIVVPWHNTKLEIEKPKELIDYPLTVMTSGNLVNLDIYTKIGGFNEDYFIDGIDIEYCLRLKKNNYKIVRLNDIEIKHDLGDIKYHNFFGKKILTTNHNYIRYYYILRNYNYIKKEYYNIAPEYCETLNHLKLRLFRIIMFENDKFRKIRSIMRGIRDYKKGVIGKYQYK